MTISPCLKPHTHLTQTATTPDGKTKTEKRSWPISRQKVLRELKNTTLPGRVVYDLRKHGVAEWTDPDGKKYRIEISGD